MEQLWRQSRGGITYWWVRLDGEPARCVAWEDEHLTRDQLLERAQRAATVAHEKERAEESLRARFPGAAIVESFLPIRGVTWEGEEGTYIYALSARRRQGEYRVLDAIPVQA